MDSCHSTNVDSSWIRFIFEPIWWSSKYDLYLIFLYCPFQINSIWRFDLYFNLFVFKFKWNYENFLPLVIFHQFLGSFRVIAAFTSNHLSFPQQRFLLSTSLEIHVKYQTQSNPISETILSVCSLDLMHYSKHFQMFDNSEGSEALGSYMQQMSQILHNFD